jgi:hypothetical protein
MADNLTEDAIAEAMTRHATAHDQIARRTE